jgi:hypothetical protein
MPAARPVSRSRHNDRGHRKLTRDLPEAAEVVAASALGVMLISHDADLGAIGHFPDLYDPGWYPEKLLAAFAEGAAGLAVLACVILSGMARKPSGTSAP